MRASRISRCWSLTLLAIAASIAVATSATSASPWTLGVGLGALTAESMSTTYNSAPSFAAVLGSVSAERQLHGPLGLRFDADYFRKRDPMGLVTVPENPPSSVWLTQHYVPIALSLRLHSPDRGLRTRGFAQIGPSVLVAHYTRTGVLRSGGPFYGQPIVETPVHDAATRIVPAVSGVFGLRARTSDHTAAEWGLRSIVSSRIGRVRLSPDTASDYDKLVAFSMTLGLSWTP